MCVYLWAKGECKVWKSDATSATLTLKSTFISPQGCAEMWPDSIYSVPVTHKEKPATESKLVCVCVCVCVCVRERVYVWLMALLRFKLPGPCFGWLVDVSSYNGLLCEAGWWGGEIKTRRERERVKERETEMKGREGKGRAAPDIFVKLDFVVQRHDAKYCRRGCQCKRRMRVRPYCSLKPLFLGYVHFIHAFLTYLEVTWLSQC